MEPIRRVESLNVLIALLALVIMEILVAIILGFQV